MGHKIDYYRRETWYTRIGYIAMLAAFFASSAALDAAVVWLFAQWESPPPSWRWLGATSALAVAVAFWTGSTVRRRLLPWKANTLSYHRQILLWSGVAFALALGIFWFFHTRGSTLTGEYLGLILFGLVFAGVVVLGDKKLRERGR
jgi:hypothetical protein